MKLLKIIAATALLAAAAQLHASNILITKFDFDDFHQGYENLAAALSFGGNTVDIVDAKPAGALAAALAAESYDQVYLFDLTSALYLTGADTSALASFWNSHKGLVVDSRSYGYYYQGTNASEVALIQNVSENFELTGGGVWVGTDHNPEWTNNGNAFLNAINVNPITGLYGDPVNYADPASVLLDGVTPTDLWGGGQSIGKVPVGVQPNGVTMYMHFGHTNTDGSILPYISASFPLQGPGPKPPSVPDSGATLPLLAGVIAALAVARRRLA